MKTTMVPQQHVYNDCIVYFNGIARLTPIKTGIQEGWQVQATEGLKPGAKVIVVGHKDVKEGAPVEVLRTISDAKELMQ